MKLHLPVRLFRTIVALCSLAVVTATSCYVSSAAVPDGYQEVIITMEEELTNIRHTESDRAFLVKTDLLVDGIDSSLMGTDAGSWYFSGLPDISMCFTNATNSVFNVDADHRLTFAEFEQVGFSENATSSQRGGAIYGGLSNSTIELIGNGSVMFSENSVVNTSPYSYGGGGAAIHGDYYCTITLSDNGSVTFIGNKAVLYAPSGGAIMNRGDMTLNNNGSVEFCENSSSGEFSSEGGAIGGSGDITLNYNGLVEFSGNTASASTYASGGAIYRGDDSTITLCDNVNVTFSGNTAEGSSGYTHGGAIYTTGNLNIQNNGSVLFEKNAEMMEGKYHLRSLYAGGSGSVISLSAVAGNSIEFRDSVYVDFGSTLELNADYTDEDGVIHKQTGDIIFTGAHTEQHLKELIAAAGVNRAATEAEILKSRTTEVCAMTNLYGGRLRVEDGAVYRGQGITALGAGADTVLAETAMQNQVGYSLTSNSANTLELKEHSELYDNVTQELTATTVLVKDATLNHTGYNLTFSTGTKLELEGNSKVYADIVQMQAGSTFLLNTSQTEDICILETSLHLEGNMELNPGNNRKGENIKLMYVSGGVSGWDADRLSVSHSAPYTAADVQWVGHFLVANYNETTYSPYEHNITTFSQPQLADEYYFYEGILFKNCNTTDVERSDGGALYGDSYSSITLSGNGNVAFSENKSSSNGGAIFGKEKSTITLSGNESVTFSENTASSSGGAIYGEGGSTVTLRGNGNLTFRGNTVSGSFSSGGAIYASNMYMEDGGAITLNDNGRVIFSGNSASYKGGAIYIDSVNLSIRNNESVLFEKNVDRVGSGYRLRSVYVADDYGYSGSEISLSAAAGNRVEFRDSLYIDSGFTVNLNADYTDAAGGAHKQTGDVIFTGAYTEQHLNELLAAVGLNRTATEAEILESRTTEVYTMTNLYGGRLRVEDGAVYRGQGITATEGSAATVLVKDATLNHAGYNLTFTTGSKLELEGNNKVYADVVQMQAGSTLFLDISQTDGIYILESSLHLNGDLVLNPGNSREGENIKLMFMSGRVSDWNSDSLSVSGSSPYSSANIQWVGHFLVANYNEATFSPYEYGIVTFTQPQAAAEYYFYEGISFRDCDSSDVEHREGGALYGDSYSTITLSGNGRVTFSGNSASRDGGAIYGGASSTIILSGNGSVEFSGNSVSGTYTYGGAICGYGNSTITLSGNERVTFSENSATASSSAYGGAIYGDTITLSENGSVSFSGNSATAAYGGAICGSTITLRSNGSVEFIGNTAECGGAIYGRYGSTIELSGNGSVTFSGNTASYKGGAIYGDNDSTIELSGNGSVEFSGNTASYGGAIYGVGDITLSGNDSVEFNGNTASYGGAINGVGDITLSGNVSVTFSGNSASDSSSSSDYYSFAYGGAIYGDGDITLSGNDSVTFSGNTASSSYRSYGGAIYGGTIELSGNDSVTFSGNTASSSAAYGGAIYGGTIELSGNGSVTFSGNSASSSFAYGGAIYGDGDITLSGNGSVTFSGNSASSSGGAICGYGNLNIRNNDSVLFEKNAEGSGSSYRLRSIYAGRSGVVISLSAAAGKSIEFRDSVYISSGSTVELNADYTDANGVVHKQTGDIIFTGKYTEQHLNELLASAGLSRTATESEVLNSRTFEVYSKINLYGGCLRVEDGAVLDCAGLTAVEGTAATLRMKDAEVKGGTLTFNSGTALELEGENKIQSLVNLNAGSDLRFVAGGESRVSGTGSLVLGGVLSVADGADVILDVATSAAGVTVGDDASLSLRGNFSLTPGAEDSAGSKLITVGRNAELSLTDSSLLGQVALADETSGLYYQYTNGAKLLQFSGDLGTGGLNLTTAADGYTVTVSGGTNFAGDIMVLDGAVFDFRGNNTTLDAAAKISLDTGSTLKLSGSDYAVMSDVLKRATGAGNARLESEAYLSHEDKIQLTGDLIVGSGGSLYLGELPNGVHGGDAYTNHGTAPVAPCTGTLVLDGGSLTFRGSRMELGRVDVTANSSLEIWDQAGSNQKAHEYCSIAELNVNASLQLATTWKSKLDIDVLQGSGAVTVGSSHAHHEVRVHDLSGYTGLLSAAGDKTTLELNLLDNTTLNAAAQISMDAGSTLKLSGSDYAVMSDVLKRATGAGNARLESDAYLSHEDKIQLTGDLIVGSGGHLYLGELPNGVHGGDLYTDSGTASVEPCTGTLVLDGGSLTFRGSRMELGRVDVTANSSLEIWDQAGSNQKANEYCSIAELNVNASLQLATTWKSKLDIDVLQGSGAVTVGSSKEYREVRVHDLSGYTGVLSAAGSKTMLELNLVSHSELNADSVQLSNGATATLSGSGTYHLATAKTLADGVSLAEDWSGVVRLSGATLVDDTLSGLSNANSVVELNGVSGYLSRADARTGAQTYDVNLKLTDNENAAAWNLNNGYNGDKRIFTGEITGTGTLERSSFRGTHQTLVFTGDTSGWTGAINHLPDSATSSGALISTNVTFSGSQVLNVSTSTNGKGELNVTLDDEHLQAGSKVSVNGAIGANRLTVTEGTTVSLNNEVNVNTLRTAGTAELSADASVRLGGITLSADNPVSALISGVESTGSTMRGLRADAVVKNVSIISTVSAYTVSSMTLQGVQFATETEQTALTLSGVVFDGTCSFSVGETGQILLDKAILTVLVGTPAGGGNGVLALDYSDLFHCTASGELEITMDKDVELLLAAGYHTITLDLGDDVNYDNLNLTLNGATYAGNSQGVAQFSLRAVPEPTSATLSLLALAALAARRRRK